MTSSKVLRPIVATALAALLLTALPTAASAGVNAQPGDVSVTITDGAASQVPGTTAVYTLVVSNAGPNAAQPEVAPTFSQGTVGNWTCVESANADCAPNGTGPIDDFTTLSPGASVTYTIPVAIPPSAIGVLQANITVSLGDINQANNTATDTDTLAPQADLSITKTDGVTTVQPGQQVVYTIVGSNAGPSSIDIQLVDVFPVTLDDVTWTCVAAGGAECEAANGTGNLNQTDSATPPGGTVTYTVTATVSDDAIAGNTIVQTATINSLQQGADTNLANNTATDTDTIADFIADLVALKTAPATATVGGTIAYTIGVRNDGPDLAREVILGDDLPAGTTFVSMTQVNGPAALLVTPAVGSGGSVGATWDTFADGATATFTVVVQLGGTIGIGDAVVNTSVVDSQDDPLPVETDSVDEVNPAATIDPDFGNNNATVTTVIVAQATTTTTTSTSTTTLASTTTTARVGSGALARTGSDTGGPTSLALVVIGAGLILVGAAELRRRRATLG